MCECVCVCGGGGGVISDSEIEFTWIPDRCYKLHTINCFRIFGQLSFPRPRRLSLRLVTVSLTGEINSAFSFPFLFSRAAKGENCCLWSQRRLGVYVRT